MSKKADIGEFSTRNFLSYIELELQGLKYSKILGENVSEIYMQRMAELIAFTGEAMQIKDADGKVIVVDQEIKDLVPGGMKENIKRFIAKNPETNFKKLMYVVKAYNSEVLHQLEDFVLQDAIIEAEKHPNKEINTMVEKMTLRIKKDKLGDFRTKIEDSYVALYELSGDHKYILQSYKDKTIEVILTALYILKETDLKTFEKTVSDIVQACNLGEVIGDASSFGVDGVHGIPDAASSFDVDGVHGITGGASSAGVDPD